MNTAYFSNYSKQIYARVDELIEKEEIEDKKIILFGLNSSSYVIRDYLQQKGIMIAGYADNNEKKRLQSREQEPAYDPRDLYDVFGNKITILIMSKYYPEMKKQLEEIGYIENKNIYQILDVNNLEQYIDFSDTKGMREVSVEELRQIQLKLLDYVKQTCEKWGLRYYLCGGTLIGAVRHKGYIPWDDDIDVAMPMKDYKEFIRIVNSADDEYEVLNVYDHPDKLHCFFARLMYPDSMIKTWNYPDAESLGINIDIFPFFGVPDDEGEAEVFADKMERLHVQISEEFIGHESLTDRYYELQKQILAMMEEFAFDTSRNVAYLLSRFKKKEIVPRSIYDECIMAEFEGKPYPIAKGYDIYLSRLYGADYMQLPPVKDRKSDHYFRAFIRS